MYVDTIESSQCMDLCAYAHSKAGVLIRVEFEALLVSQKFLV